MNNQELILRGSILGYLLRHSATLFVGLLFLSALALVDFYFIGLLGPEELTAASFAAPVLFMGINLLLSVAVGVMIVASRLIGEGRAAAVDKVASAGLYLAFLTGGLLLLIGWGSHDRLFALLGAAPAMVDLLKDYMHIIYVNFVLMAVLIASLKIMQAFGEVRRQALAMGVVVLLNGVLDPLLIFGIGPFPAWGLKGAAAATAIATAVGVMVLLWMLRKYIRFRPMAITFHWRKVLYLAGPVSLTKTMMPLSNAAITALLAGLSGAAIAGGQPPAEVAAYGVGYRVDLIVLLFLVALSSVTAPFIGQNLGAGNPARIRRGIRLGIWINIIYGLLAGLGVICFREQIVELFTDDAAIRKEMAVYLMLAPLGYAFNGVLMLSVAVMEACGKPLRSVLVNLVYFFLLYIPLAILGGHWQGSTGVYVAYPVAGLLAAVFGVWLMWRTVGALAVTTESVPDPALASIEG